jgi:DNA polymerase-1
MPKKMMLVDGSNQAFRAFFAIQSDMRAPDGFPTRALYGFTNMLQRMLKDHEPDYVAVVFDKGKSFRNELYPDYKGQRPDMPDDLRAQWPEFIPLCHEWGICALALEGYEADDVIGTLARSHAGADCQVLIVSSDKDFCQLVDGDIQLLDVSKGTSMGPEEVRTRWGVGPEQIIDLLALMGDSSDNIPGVPGVGPKKAAKFLAKFGSVEAVLDSASVIGGKTGQRIEESRDAVHLARRLVTIVTDMKLEIGLSDMQPSTPDWAALSERFRRYDFRRLYDRVSQEMDGEAVGDVSIDRESYRTISSAEDLASLVQVLSRVQCLAVDTETTSLDAGVAELVGISFCWSDEPAVYVPIAHTSGPNCEGALAALQPILEDSRVGKVGQNLKYDFKVLLRHGVHLRGIVGDTMLADYLTAVDQRHGLDHLARRYLAHDMIPYSEVTEATEGRFADVPVTDATKYAAEDAHITWLLHEAIDTSECRSLYHDVELPLIPILAKMELQGIGLDAASLSEISTDLGQRIEALKTQIYEEAGEEFTLNSTKQLAHILFEKRGLKPIKKTKTGFSTNASVLEALERRGDALSGLMLRYRELTKLKNTYVDTLPQHVASDGRVHTSFHQAVAATGRLSSNDPNLQNIPIRTEDGRRIRQCFVAREGYQFLSADYSQVELRVLAHYCEEGPLVESFRHGEDIHRRTAAEVFGTHPGLVSLDQRRAAKAVNFGLIYGMSAFRLSNELGIGRRDAQEIIDAYFERYPQVRRYMDASVAAARDKGFAETLFGRRRAIYSLNAGNRVERAAAERVAINTPIQGTAADIIKMAMIQVDAILRSEFPETSLLLQVHDELVLEVPDSDLDEVSRRVKEAMEGAVELRVPLVVDTGSGNSWEQAH